MMEPIEGRVVLVTGGAKRIGRGIAMRLAKEGASVAIHYHNSQSEAEKTSKECGGAPLFRANLESVTEIQHMFRRVFEHFGRLDWLVNNAARFTRFDPLEITEKNWDFVHSVNLKAAFFCCQSAAKIMNQQKYGRIVNISSLGGIRPWAEHVHYCASKAGVIMMTKALAKALAPDITVNSVAPGVIPFDDRLNEMEETMTRATPAQRPGTADEIADAVIYFLRSPNYITGNLLAVDGGLNLR
jgi:NAD(P)-dependent dehydrogenase (short-subunit alcohol dehydrogenase family)